MYKKTEEARASRRRKGSGERVLFVVGSVQHCAPVTPSATAAILASVSHPGRAAGRPQQRPPRLAPGLGLSGHDRLTSSSFVCAMLSVYAGRSSPTILCSSPTLDMLVCSPC